MVFIWYYHRVWCGGKWEENRKNKGRKARENNLLSLIYWLIYFLKTSRKRFFLSTTLNRFSTLI